MCVFRSTQHAHASRDYRLQTNELQGSKTLDDSVHCESIKNMYQSVTTQTCTEFVFCKKLAGGKS